MSVLFVYFEIVDAGIAFSHEAVVVKFPVFVAVGPIPLAFFVMILVFEADGDAVAGVGPEFFFQFVVQLLFPFAGEELHHLFAAVEEFVAVAPFGVGGIGHGYAGGVLCIPGVFGQLYFFQGGLEGERREGRGLFGGRVLGRSWFHILLFSFFKVRVRAAGGVG